MNIFDTMLSRYEIKTNDDYRNALHEVMQQIALAGLYRGGFFEHAAFYGGTCLRIFHQMQRFSDDMDFSLLQPNKKFMLEDYFKPIINEFTERNVKIKIELDIVPPLEFSTESKLLLLPYSFMTRCYTLPSLYAGKMHALLFRKWSNRVKGRDWYDFEWYVKNNVSLDFTHLCERTFQFESIEGKQMTHESFKKLLKEKIINTKIDMIIADVKPFLKDPTEINIWSTNYFLQLTDLISFK